MHLDDWIVRTGKARRDAHLALATHESAISRVILLEELVKRLSGTPVDVQDYFREAICCLENKLYRSAIVVAWAGFFHVFSERLYNNCEMRIRDKRQNWSFNELAELREAAVESQILIVAKDVNFITRAQLRRYDGQLSERNQCAHPTLYRPSMNVAIGYVDATITQTIGCLGR